ncbi:hypothetical protein GYMLUDRAFT_35606 [Collybiopsis luxurians FD-317 M1]|nr:hypothetical protein GYMLUDRAFT_35606 [Collybiopsis luxurians FD-317 M1]
MTAWTSAIGIPTQEESEMISNLLAMIGGSESQAGDVLEVLRRHGGNVERAADALLGDELTSSTSAMTGVGSSSTSMALVPFNQPSARPNTPVGVVDLTKDDAMDVDEDEMKRALAMSLQDSGSGGERNQNAQRNGDEINRPKEPLEILIEEEQEEVLDFDAMLRIDDRPIALRPQTPDFAPAVLLLQALYHVPQVRARLATANVQDDSESSGELEVVRKSLELFTNLDLANISKLETEELCAALSPLLSSLSSSTVYLGVPESTRDVYDSITKIFEKAVDSTAGNPLFTFTSTQVNIFPGPELKMVDFHSIQNTSVFLDISTNSGASGQSDSTEPNDLVTRLAKDLSRPLPNPPGGSSGTAGGSTQSVISTPSEVVAFVLSSSGSGSFPNPFSTTTSIPTAFSVPLHSTASHQPSPSPFVYPPHIYIDPFLRSNLPLMHNKRLERERLGRGLRESEGQKSKLLGQGYVSQSGVIGPKLPPAPIVNLPGYNDAVKASAHDDLYDDPSKPQGVLPALRAALYYYEHVANRGVPGDPEGEARRRTVEETERGLKATVEGVEKVLRDLDKTIASTKAQMRALFEGEELKKHRYDLRAVLMQPTSSASSTALPSYSQLSQPSQSRPAARKQHLFAYVQDFRELESESSPQPQGQNSAKRPGWWKISASGRRDGVEEVSEEAVFSFSTSTDAASYTPYMLIYSKTLDNSLPTDVEWPAAYVAAVKQCNERFRETLEASRMHNQVQTMRGDVSMMEITA